MKIIFLDFDGELHTEYYDIVMCRKGLPANDSFGAVFDPNCVLNLKKIIDETGADIVVPRRGSTLSLIKTSLTCGILDNCLGS